MRYSLILLLLVLISCETDIQIPAESPAETYHLAPMSPDAKIYAVAETQRYHCRMNCADLRDHDREIITVAEAEAQNYTPCNFCFPFANYVPPEPRVYVMSGDTQYHNWGCRLLTEEKQLLLTAEAIREGYEPCPQCAVHIRLRGALNRWVYVTETGITETDVYHTNPDCKHLDPPSEVVDEGKAGDIIGEYGEDMHECADCGEERHTDEGE